MIWFRTSGRGDLPDLVALIGGLLSIFSFGDTVARSNEYGTVQLLESPP